MRNSADTELNKHIAYIALSSGNLLKKGTTPADTFVVIDVENGRV
jgi:hypothetical protein